MPLYDPQNLYAGVNPHLNSFLQQPKGTWKSFHSELITEIRRTLDQTLPSGYLALSEQGLQIDYIDWQEPLMSIRQITPDITIYRDYKTPLSSPAASAATLTEPSLIIKLQEALMEEEQYLMSIIIYALHRDNPIGQAITRFELLSSANKPQDSYYLTYKTKRLESLKSGLCLVEMDLLHETRPIIPNLLSYIDGHPSASPYHILVSDPRPTWEGGNLEIYAIQVLDALPKVKIPLNGQDFLVLDMNKIYHQVYQSWRFAHYTVDYEREPINFHAYTPIDQQLIRHQMAQIQTLKQG